MADIFSVDFLPRGLVDEFRLFPVLFALGEFFVADENVCGAIVEVDAYFIAGLYRPDHHRRWLRGTR